MIRKLLDKRGESLSEVLVAILIVALSAAMLATMISAAVSINLKANEATDKMYEELTAAETGERIIRDDATIFIDAQGIPVSLYGYEDGLMAYRKEG